MTFDTPTARLFDRLGLLASPSVLAQGMLTMLIFVILQKFQNFSLE
ncbi:hypothetical protein H6F97_00070 [Microcoleus sp. FACHB-1]|nr:hypothetical protein [Microcoleus sp. FACHB-1]